MSTTKKLDSLRQRIASLKGEILELRSMPLNPAEAESRVNAMVSTLAAQFDSGWLGKQIASPGHIDLRDDAIMQTACAGSPDKTAALLAFLVPETVRAALLDSTLPYATGQMTESERTAQLAKLEAELHRVEIDEEREITQLEMQGVEAFRRPDVDPAIILNVA